MDVLRLDARTDFRLEKLAGVKMWLVPADGGAAAALDKAWARMTGNGQVQAARHLDQGPHPARAAARRMASRDFPSRISARSRSAPSDYLRLAHDYHTIMIDRIPVMDYAERNAAKRFITLIDTLYDNAVKLMASAAADPAVAVPGDEGHEANEFKRTVVAADRDEFGILSGAAARPQGFRRQRVQTGLVET